MLPLVLWLYTYYIGWQYLFCGSLEAIVLEALLHIVSRIDCSRSYSALAVFVNEYLQLHLN